MQGTGWREKGLYIKIKKKLGKKRGGKEILMYRIHVGIQGVSKVIHQHWKTRM